jgi:hypothetical protein
MLIILYFLNVICLSIACITSVVLTWIDSAVIRLFRWKTWFPLQNICVTNNHQYVPFIVIYIRFFTNSWLNTVFVSRVTRRVPLVEQKLFTPVFSGVGVARSLVFCVMFCRSLLVRVSYFFLLAIVLYVLRFTASDYPFGIFNIFLLII